MRSDFLSYHRIFDVFKNFQIFNSFLSHFQHLKTLIVFLAICTLDVHGTW